MKIYDGDCEELYEAMKDGTWYTLLSLTKKTSVSNPHKRMGEMRKRGYIVETMRKHGTIYYKLVHGSIPVADDTLQFPEINSVRSEKRNTEMLIEQMNHVRVLAAHCGNQDIERVAKQALLAAGVQIDDE
jgi:hypothetical protein